MPAFPTGTVTFLFTDIESSARLWEEYPDAMPHALVRHDALLRGAIEAHGGVIFKTVGDAFCAAFDAAPPAVAAALAAQRSLTAASWTEVGALKVRIALYTGLAEYRDGDYFGRPLNRADRFLTAMHGGQVLVSRATVELARDQLAADTVIQDLGEHRFKGIAEAERVYQLVAPGLAVDFPALLSANATNLPARLPTMIGRERDVKQVRDLVLDAEVPLLTLTGPGGVGKTRLALAAAAEAMEAFPDGVWFVPLDRVADPERVEDAIGDALDLADEENGLVRARVLGHLRPRKLLLVLDNFEHLTSAAPRVSGLLAACPRVTILATSRSELGVGREREYPVAPLAVPRGAEASTVDRLAEATAVQLFVERAQAVKPNFALTNGNAATVAAICRRLDGLPLAIELAAARIRLLTPRAMLARIEQCLDWLTTEAPDLPPRQRELRTAIAWSHDLLSPAERILFRRLAVFVGGCTLDAAERVLSAESGVLRNNEPRLSPDSALSTQHSALDALASLVDHNLLRQEEQADGEPRLTMLELIHDFAHEQLVASGELDAVADAHAAYYLTLAARAAAEGAGIEPAVWQVHLEPECDNLRAALARRRERGATIGLADDEVARLHVVLDPFLR